MDVAPREQSIDIELRGHLLYIDFLLSEFLNRSGRANGQGVHVIELSNDCVGKGESKEIVVGSLPEVLQRKDRQTSGTGLLRQHVLRMPPVQEDRYCEGRKN